MIRRVRRRRSRWAHQLVNTEWTVPRRALVSPGGTTARRSRCRRPQTTRRGRGARGGGGREVAETVGQRRVRREEGVVRQSVARSKGRMRK